MNSVRKMNILRINKEKLEDTFDLIIEEIPLEIFVNYEFLCGPYVYPH